MKLKTKYFGEIEYRQEDVIRFPQGLFGFEEDRAFLLLPFSGSAGTLLCLQSVQTPELAFVAMNPFSLKPDYAPQLQSEELKALEVARSTDLCYYVLCVVREPVAESTVNLKCPVAVNDITRQACQVILNSDDYHMRHKLAEFNQERTGEPC